VEIKLHTATIPTPAEDAEQTECEEKTAGHLAYLRGLKAAPAEIVQRDEKEGVRTYRRCPRRASMRHLIAERRQPGEEEHPASGDGQEWPNDRLLRAAIPYPDEQGQLDGGE
jgi:hypothetical protein